MILQKPQTNAAHGRLPREREFGECRFPAPGLPLGIESIEMVLCNSGMRFSKNFRLAHQIHGAGKQRMLI